MKKSQKDGPEIICWSGDYYTRLHNRQKVQKHQAYEEAGHEVQGEMHC
jgi:hypothetical protein